MSTVWIGLPVKLDAEFVGMTLEVDPPPAHDAVDFVVRAGLSGGDNCERRPSRRATRAATEVRSDCEKVR
jgi:hypothetical protein